VEAKGHALAKITLGLSRGRRSTRVTGMTTTERAYEGGELGLFASAVRWKGYWSSKIKPHLGENVLEVGAGLGVNTPYLCGPKQKRWVCLEPDPALAAKIPETVSAYPWRGIVKTQVGTLRDVPEEPVFDSLVYIDVLEHIEHDAEELRAALLRLKPGGRVIVLSPAHPQLFTEFDREIGHFRRYTKSTLRAVSPTGGKLQELYYLDAAGLLASLANRMLLHQSMPSLKQVLFWDRWLVWTSLFLDPLVGFQLGKTVIGVWVRE
jgi:protein-L-isoaspartate O-methyltransferase